MRQGAADAGRNDGVECHCRGTPCPALVVETGGNLQFGHPRMDLSNDITQDSLGEHQRPTNPPNLLWLFDTANRRDKSLHVHPLHVALVRQLTPR